MTTPKRHMAVEPFFTPKELAERWRVNRATISKLVTAGKLAVLRIGKSVRIKESEVARYERVNYRRAA